MSRARRFLGCPLLAAFGPILAVSIVTCGASTAWARSFGAIEVIVQPQATAEAGFVQMRPGGCVEQRITVINHSKVDDHVVRLVNPAKSAAQYTDYLQRDSRTVEVPHGATLVVSLFQPALTVAEETLAVDIDGLRQNDSVELPSPFQNRGAYSYGYAPGATSSRPCLAVLAGRGIPQDYKDKVRTAHPNEVNFCRSELSCSDWSPHWLGYTGYDLVLITAPEAASLTADALLALRRYVEVGGVVLILAATTNDDNLVPEGLRDPAVPANDDGTFNVGFGLVRPAPDSDLWPNELWTARSKGEAAPGDRHVQVAMDVTVPIRGLLLLMILFAFGIGPVNVWLLSRRQKRMWLWWNVPAISLATCLAVFAYSAFAEGFAGRGRTALITLLDENTHRAATIGYASYYCPLTPSDGLHFSYDTEVAQLVTGGVGALGMRGGRGKTLDWTNDQHLDSGWVVARVPACFAIRQSETSRQRLPIHKAADGTVTVVNGLGVTIDSLYVVDESGAVHVATELPAGEERTLQSRQAADAGAPPGALRGVFDRAWNSTLQELRESPERFVARGCYLAVVKQSPFLADPLSSAPQEGSSGVIYGISARAENGS